MLLSRDVKNYLNLEGVRGRNKCDSLTRIDSIIVRAVTDQLSIDLFAARSRFSGAFFKTVKRP